MQWGPELDSAPNDFALLQRDHRRDNFDSCFRACTGANQFLKCPVIFGPAVRVAGAVLGNGADINSFRANGLRPAHCYGEKMGVAKRHVGYGNLAVGPTNTQLVFGHGNLLIRQSGAPYGAEVVELHDQPFADSIKVGDVREGTALAGLCALPITRMEGRDFPGTVALARDGSSNAGIHSPAQQHYGLSMYLAHKDLRTRLCS